MNAENLEPTYAELLQQNLALRQEVDALQQSSHQWWVYAEVSRKLQIYSASIRAAVSSLLDRDIFWDGANQHEFLTTINTSVSQVSDLTILLTLAFRAEDGSLPLKLDPQELQEILSMAQGSAKMKFPELSIQNSYPAKGKLVLVDYDYFTKALLFLFEVFNSSHFAKQVSIAASETETEWHLDFAGISPTLIETIKQIYNGKAQSIAAEALSAENILRLKIVCEVFHLQATSVELVEKINLPPVLRLSLPAVADSQERLK